MSMCCVFLSVYRQPMSVVELNLPGPRPLASRQRDWNISYYTGVYSPPLRLYEMAMNIQVDNCKKDLYIDDLCWQV